MTHSGDANEFFEIASNKLWPIVRDNSRRHIRKFFTCALQDDFYIRFFHRLPDLIMNDVTIVPVQNAAKVLEGAADIQIRDIGVPMLMCSNRLSESGSFL